LKIVFSKSGAEWGPATNFEKPALVHGEEKLLTAGPDSREPFRSYQAITFKLYANHALNNAEKQEGAKKGGYPPPAAVLSVRS
jgi:hypothetical protein